MLLFSLAIDTADPAIWEFTSCSLPPLHIYCYSIAILTLDRHDSCCYYAQHERATMSQLEL